mmetsp:Transcript_11043/g.35066  ORF Transcript_11043/g.35066 Transcript_11043/m.35066 type:complete len:220 (-) Transcript_11043:152-811(-)
MARPSGASGARKNLALAVHVSAYLGGVYVWSWHLLSRGASKIPGYYGFGWFFKFLTFIGLTLQIIQLLLCSAAYFAPKRHRIHVAADDMSSLVFACASFITLGYYGLPVAGLMFGNKPVFWLDICLHVMNTVVAWIDLLLCERTFSARAEKSLIGFFLGYICWLLVQKKVNGTYPYVFLNHFTSIGFVSFVASNMVVTYGIFRLGRTLSTLTNTKAKAA